MDTGIGPDHHMEAGVAGGVVLVLLSVTTLQLIETVLLAVLGAVVSFTTSVGLKWVWKQWERKRSGKR